MDRAPRAFIIEGTAPGDFFVQGLLANAETLGLGLTLPIIFAGRQAGEALVGVFVRGGSNHGWTRINTDTIGPSFAEAIEVASI